MWLPWDLTKAYLPLPVFLNRLAADRLVLIFGIPSLLVDLAIKVRSLHVTSASHTSALKNNWRER
jgi:hypothetical protein